MKTYDLVLIGGGIVGVSTAWQLQQRYPDAAILLVEKETALAQHQTGRNSGVIHAGVYYEPGSLKADLCRRGSQQILDFCRDQGLPFEQCGKLLVATDPGEYERMDALALRCVQNGIAAERLSASELSAREPRITGLGALLVPATAITDYRLITARMAERFCDLGGEIRCGSRVAAVHEDGSGVQVTMTTGRIAAKYLVACAGLMADRLARLMKIPVEFQIMPFRGEYHRLPAARNSLIRHLIYPIPDPALPFLGVHLTRMIGDGVTVGPNAVLGWQREGYGRLNLGVQDTLELLGFPGFWRFARGHLGSGIREYRDSLSRAGYLRRVTKYCPELQVADLLPYPTGIRAQAVLRDGSLVHDFLFAASPRSLHVCNAPSPAATSSIAIGAYLCEKVQSAFDF